MTADRAQAAGGARLLALRLQGFKSFAERTIVEFGPGISAIVGPNGSGKSNLADALRWALGEQGRALRSRKSEDVIFAGSERRAALGMADVTLVLDNSDGLLPVEYTVLELGRRLYRSGENDYLLNRQRVRLRDLVDLLDSAHLADNAFLFIGQGMVDQALALRPEERRPLFEEVAGVRRHERRRRKAEEQLAESEANLARVQDILAELRPQARRLAAQAQQQTSRLVAGEELAAAIVAAAHARWFEASGRQRDVAARRARAAADADRAMAELQAAEEEVAAVSDELGARAAVEEERRTAHEAAREALTGARLREARLAGELEGIDRDRARLTEERSAAEADLAARRRIAAQPVPERDRDLEAAAVEADRALTEASAELGALRAANRARGEEAAALRRAEAARHAEAETAERRLADAERRAAEERRRGAELDERRADFDVERRRASERLASAIAAEQAASARREETRATADTAEAARAAATARGSVATEALATLRGRAEALAARIAEDEARGIARAARRHGGRRLDEELVVDPDLRPAVEAALADTARAYVVAAGAIGRLAGERGAVVPDDPAPSRTTPAESRDAAVRDHVAEHGGGFLDDAVRRDPTGAARRLLARAIWLPDLEACLAVRAALPPGWIAVPRDGAAVVSADVVALGRGDTPLERRAELTRLEAEVARATSVAEGLAAAAREAAERAQVARAAVAEARDEESRAAGERRRAEEEDRIAARRAEAAVREASWSEAQLARLDGEVERLRDAARLLATPVASPADGGQGLEDDAAISAWETRIAELRTRRDRLALDLAGQDTARREAETRRARAEAAAAMDDERIARAEVEAAALGGRERAIRAELDELRTELAAAIDREERTRTALDELRSADAADRERLGVAERASLAARERLRVADERLRAADHAELEARLGLEAMREQLLVELAALGDLGLRVLGAAAETSAEDDPGLVETYLQRRSDDWAAAAPIGEPPPPGRLAWLRRRYHELGAGNPFAVEEYEELKARLEALEGQERDLRQAIVRTRELIDELNGMIAEQFRSTFRALETAFDARFQQLFGGGFARLTLTDPGDLSATGVEIVARPPGKKAQALAMLSGGERALTAVALLFAMLEVRPVPFCVLDEVDAALDEANVGRFTEALRGLAAQTQFVVITHNRGTIETADALYGVTVGDDSVSRVISLRLDEAEALADGGRGAALVDLPVG